LRRSNELIVEFSLINGNVFYVTNKVPEYPALIRAPRTGNSKSTSGPSD